MYLVLERGEGTKKGRETSMCSCLSHAACGDLAHNPGMCPDWELNLQPFVSQAGTQSTEPHQPGLFNVLNISEYRSFTSLVRFIPRHFILFHAIVNGIVFLISLSVGSFLAYENATDFWTFCILLLC